MESPFIIIIENNDLLQKLEEYIIKAYLNKKSKELEDSRNFHENNYQNRIDVNKYNRYLISIAFNQYLYEYAWDWDRESRKKMKEKISVYEYITDHISKEEVIYYILVASGILINKNTTIENYNNSTLYLLLYLVFSCIIFNNQKLKNMNEPRTNPPHMI